MYQFKRKYFIIWRFWRISFVGDWAAFGSNRIDYSQHIFNGRSGRLQITFGDVRNYNRPAAAITRHEHLWKGEKIVTFLTANVTFY